MRPKPIGRTTRMSLYSPGGEKPMEWPDGTWLESESFAYPNDTFTRRAYARMDDGTFRVAKCKVADSFFTIPARIRVKGKTVKGYLSSSESGLTFTVCDDRSKHD